MAFSDHASEAMSRKASRAQQLDIGERRGTLPHAQLTWTKRSALSLLPPFFFLLRF
jgi:hypothetical protein